MNANDGQYLEQLTLLIEKSLDPHSKMKHNVQMPILNSQKGTTTQCDIVIWSGSPNRETVTIIEVQDRNSRVKPNDFRGWQLKLEEVGAQHLICVSKQEFPASIKEKAYSSGNKIHLVHLTDKLPDKIPLNLLRTQCNLKYHELISIGDVRLTLPESEINNHELFNTEVKIREKCYSFVPDELLSLIDIFNKFYNPKEHENESKEKLIFKLNKDPALSYCINGRYIPIGLSFEFCCQLKTESVPVSVLSYLQNGEALAWVLESYRESPDGKGLMGFSIPVRPNGDNYSISNMSLNMPEGSQITFEVKKK